MLFCCAKTLAVPTAIAINAATTLVRTKCCMLPPYFGAATKGCDVIVENSIKPIDLCKNNCFFEFPDRDTVTRDSQLRPAGFPASILSS